MDIQNIKLDKIRVNKDNPRTISKEKFEKLINLILVFPKMLEIRPIVVDEDFMALGGNQRTEALNAISKMEITAISERLLGLADFKRMDKSDRENNILFWRSWLNDKKVPIINARTLTEDEKKQFIIKDNAGFGDWDWDILNNTWDSDLLTDWGLDILDDWDTDKNKKGKNETETEKLSEIKYNGLYYEPQRIPQIKLSDCLNLDKFNAKVRALDEYDLSKKQKEMLKLFAYRFIKIDFEAIANYYAFNATEEEKKAIERLRLVLTDNGEKGFIEDDMLRILRSDLLYIEEK